MPYSFIVENNNGDTVVALQDIMSPRYSRRRNSADQFSLELPRERQETVFVEDSTLTADNAIITADSTTLTADSATLEANLIGSDSSPTFSEVLLGRRVEIRRNGSYEASGFITERGYGPNSLMVDGHTEEILMERYLTPTQFGYPLTAEYPTLDVFAANMIKKWTSINLKHKDQYTPHVILSSNIDFDANPEIVYMTKTSTVTYNTTAFLELRFLSSDVNDFLNWDRVRWVADYADNAKVEVSIRTGPDEATTNITNYSTPVSGALTDVVGLLIPNNTNPVLDVRFDFSTTDNKLSANLFAVEVITREPSGITEGTFFGDPSMITVPMITADDSSALEVMIDAFQEVDWEFRVRNKQLDISENFGTDKTNDFTLMAG